MLRFVGELCESALKRSPIRAFIGELETIETWGTLFRRSVGEITPESCLTGESEAMSGSLAPMLAFNDISSDHWGLLSRELRMVVSEFGDGFCIGIGVDCRIMEFITGPTGTGSCAISMSLEARDMVEILLRLLFRPKSTNVPGCFSSILGSVDLAPPIVLREATNSSLSWMALLISIDVPCVSSNEIALTFWWILSGRGIGSIRRVELDHGGALISEMQYPGDANFPESNLSDE